MRFASAAAELLHFEALFAEDSSADQVKLLPLDTDPCQETKFRPEEQLLDPTKRRHALLLDLQRLDARRRFPLRISRQELLLLSFL